MITLEIDGGPEFEFAFTAGMNGQDALEAAYNTNPTPGDFTFSLQYYGSSLGYLVDMVNETYDTFISKFEPFFFWEFLVNGVASPTGINNTLLQDGDTIEFKFTRYESQIHAGSTLQTKYKLKKLAMA